MSSAHATHPPIRSAALIGLGAVGTLYAAQISARDPRCLRIVADAARIARYRADPPSLNGRRLDLVYGTPEESGPPADLVLVAVKSTSLADALPAIASRLAEHTQILPLLNGITAQDVLADAFGGPRVLYGFVYCSSAMRTGNAVVQGGGEKIVFGEATNSPPSPRVRAVADFFDRLGIRHDVPADMRAAQWKKFILNVGINQAQAVLRAPSREIQQTPEALRFARTLMDEAAAVGVALGIAGAADVPAWAEGVILGAAPENKTSMLQDVEAGRVPEIDLFAETVCRLGNQCGIPTPANEMALRLLKPA
ncbi:MAG: ketopantoate reductase family protein [Opitutae bacterium]|nr:ketopantoate reductase family protein [Opitutae bacterium]